MLALDHIAVCAATLAEGVRAVETVLGVPLATGGAHPHMGTHNRLLGLGPGFYLEVIAIDPDAPGPVWPRWFDLDHFSGPPRLTNWIVRAEGQPDALDAALAAAPAGAGRAVALERGDFRWRMGVPDTGVLPFDDAFPALIQWQGGLHPSDRLPDSGCRLARLEVSHPDGAALRAALPLADPRLVIRNGPRGLRAILDTPQGQRTLA